MKIITHKMQEQVPVDKSWAALFDTHKFGDCIGYGKTEDEAIVDLMEKQHKGEME